MSLLDKIDAWHGNEHQVWRDEFGRKHREDGPAHIFSDSSREWFLHGHRHRVDGPACEWADGCESWWLNGRRHREDGPAIIDIYGNMRWYLYGEPYEPMEWLIKVHEIGTFNS